MEYRDFMSLTNEEIRQIVTDIFKPKKITCITRDKKWEEIECKIYTEWETTDDDGKPNMHIIADYITLRNPFNHDNLCALEVPFTIDAEDIYKYKQFCVAKGFVPWLKDNPYLTVGEWVKDEHEHGKCSVCGHDVDLMSGASHNYCEMCGTKMTGIRPVKEEG